MFVYSFQVSCRMRCIYMSMLLKTALRDVCECSRKPTERDAHSRYPIVRAADAYPRNEASWSVSSCSMNQAVQEVHAWSKNESARDTCVSSRNETDESGPEMKPPKISACVPERNRQRYLDVCQNETARDICVYEWNWRIYLHVFQNETARDICVCSRKEPDGHTYACFRNETARDIPPGLKSGEVSVRVPVNWGKKKRKGKGKKIITIMQPCCTPGRHSTVHELSQHTNFDFHFPRVSPIQSNRTERRSKVPHDCEFGGNLETRNGNAYHAVRIHDVSKASDTDCLSRRWKKGVNSMRYITGKCGIQASGKVRKISTSHFCTL